MVRRCSAKPAHGQGFVANIKSSESVIDYITGLSLACCTHVSTGDCCLSLVHSGDPADQAIRRGDSESSRALLSQQLAAAAATTEAGAEARLWSFAFPSRR